MVDDKMHVLHVHQDRVKCSCGYGEPAMLGVEARNMALTHAQNNTPALVRDLRLCSDECKHMATDAINPSSAGYHHPNCSNPDNERVE